MYLFKETEQLLTNYFKHFSDILFGFKYEQILSFIYIF